MDIEKVISLLRVFFANHPDIQLSFLFGSSVKGYFTKEIDIDIAVLFDKKPELNLIFELKEKLESI